ncbi:MAG: molybdenum ABC transporter ATP-binding protein, partial [Chloroflexota bacterium]
GIPMIAAITTGALDELGISPGSGIHLSFKASSVHLF